MSVCDRILTLVDITEQTGCWLWKGALSVDGYGFITITRDGRRRQERAHRAAYEAFVGPIPNGMQALHNCDRHYPAGDKTSRRCVNPAHLFLGTNVENMADMARKGRAARGDRHGSRLVPGAFAGEKNGRAKLAADDVVAIRAARARGETLKSISLRYGVARPTIARAVNGAGWRNV